MTTYQDLGYDKIFVSLDGTEAQAKVLDRAIIMAANHNAELYIGHVIDSTALETAGTYPVDLIAALEKVVPQLHRRPRSFLRRTSRTSRRSRSSSRPAAFARRSRTRCST